ncbi:hypothetical protein BaRGS_00026774, partial [Batillaria attramentaria]
EASPELARMRRCTLPMAAFQLSVIFCVTVSLHRNPIDESICPKDKLRPGCSKS